MFGADEMETTSVLKISPVIAYPSYFYGFVAHENNYDRVTSVQLLL